MHALPVGLDMTSAEELEEAVVSAVRLDVRLSSDTLVPRKAWRLQWPHTSKPSALVGKYFISLCDSGTGDADAEGIFCLNVQNGDVWRLPTSFNDVQIRWDRMKVDASREIMINGEVGIVLTLSNAECVFASKFKSTLKCLINLSIEFLILIGYFFDRYHVQDQPPMG